MLIKHNKCTGLLDGTDSFLSSLNTESSMEIQSSSQNEHIGPILLNSGSFSQTLSEEEEIKQLLKFYLRSQNKCVRISLLKAIENLSEEKPSFAAICDFFDFQQNIQSVIESEVENEFVSIAENVRRIMEDEKIASIFHTTSPDFEVPASSEAISNPYNSVQKFFHSHTMGDLGKICPKILEICYLIKFESF